MTPRHSVLQTLRLMLASIAALALLAPNFARADNASPDVLVKNVTNEVLDIVRKDKDIQAGDARKAAQIIETKILPNFDFNRMTALAVGRDWRSANPEQQKALSDEFRTLLVRTYANALTQYRDQSIDFKPYKGKPDDTETTVRTEVKQPGAKAISIDYSLRKEDSGAWKVIDVIVGGVSLVTSYRDQFRQQVASGGIDGLIKSLQEKNKAPPPPPVPATANK